MWPASGGSIQVAAPNSSHEGNQAREKMRVATVLVLVVFVLPPVA